MPNRDTFLALLGGTVENNKNFGGNSKGHTSLQRQRFENLLTEQITCKLLCNGAWRQLDTKSKYNPNTSHHITMDIFLHQDIYTNKSMVQCANSLCTQIIRIVSIHGCNLLPVRLELVAIRPNLRTTLYLILSFNGCSILVSKAVCSLNPSVQTSISHVLREDTTENL